MSRSQSCSRSRPFVVVTLTLSSRWIDFHTPSVTAHSQAKAFEGAMRVSGPHPGTMCVDDRQRWLS